MDPDSHSNREFLFPLPHFGKIAIDPSEADFESLQEAKFVIFPKQMTDEQFYLAGEWAARTQTPIYCIQDDVKRLNREGFCDYRFQALKGYRKFRFSKGAIEFFPVQRLKKVLFFEWDRPPVSYNTLLRPDGEKPMLFLSDLSINQDDAKIYKNFYARVVSLVSAKHPDEWTQAESLLNCKVSTKQELIKKFLAGVYLWEKSRIHQEAQSSDGKAISSKLLEAENG